MDVEADLGQTCTRFKTIGQLREPFRLNVNGTVGPLRKLLTTVRWFVQKGPLGKTKETQHTHAKMSQR